MGLTRKDLLEKVWRFDFDPGTNMVDVNVARLRAKLVGLSATCRLSRSPTRAWLDASA